MAKKNYCECRAGRLTKHQQFVVNYMLSRPDCTLEQAITACNQNFTYIRKWMVDKEFHGYWSDIRRWRRATARERVEQAISLTAKRLEDEVRNTRDREKNQLMELGEDLLRTADRLMSLDEAEKRDPVSSFGWAETVGFPGVDGPQPRVVGPPAGGMNGTGRSAAEPPPLPSPPVDDQRTLTKEEFAELIRKDKACRALEDGLVLAPRPGLDLEDVRTMTREEMEELINRHKAWVDARCPDPPPGPGEVPTPRPWPPPWPPK